MDSIASSSGSAEGVSTAMPLLAMAVKRGLASTSAVVLPVGDIRHDTSLEPNAEGPRKRYRVWICN